ncbi:MAG: hypothetical protein H7Z75_16590 [Ferruginibacter sp.]|nr:hypothetical protein [Cytophagales bacterium]
MKPISHRARWVTAVFFLLTFFSAGGGTVESLVNYPTWLLIGAAEFKAYHQALGPRIVASMVLPALFATVFNVLMLWFRPSAIPRWSVWTLFILGLIGWVSTAVIQIPIQAQLDETGFSKEAIERLISTDLPLRVIPGFLRLGLAFWMLLRIMTPYAHQTSGLAPGYAGFSGLKY